MNQSKMNQPKPKFEGTTRAYVTGFVLSIVLTLAAYTLVVGHVFPAAVITGCIIVLAVVQFLVQMLFFLHLGRETKPRWKLFVALYMVMVVLILVLGSLWIMNNLNSRMMPAQMLQYVNGQNGF